MNDFDWCARGLPALRRHRCYGASSMNRHSFARDALSRLCVLFDNGWILCRLSSFSILVEVNSLPPLRAADRVAALVRPFKRGAFFRQDQSGFFVALTTSQLFRRSAITAVRLKTTRILLQINTRQRENRKNTAIHKTFTYSMGNSGRVISDIDF